MQFYENMKFLFVRIAPHIGKTLIVAVKRSYVFPGALSSQVDAKGPITRIAPSGYNLIFGVGHQHDRISLGLRLNSMLAAFTV